MDNITIREATIEDARHVAHNLRQGDIDELHAYKLDIRPAIMVIEGYQDSTWCRVAVIDDEAALIYGVTPTHKEGEGVVWMLATDKIMQFSREFVRGCRGEVAEMQKLYPKKLFNYVHKDNAVAKTWLKWLGFKINEKEHCKLGFQYFERGIKHV